MATKLNIELKTAGNNGGYKHLLDIIMTESVFLNKN